MKILDFFLFFWVIFALLDPDPQFNVDPDLATQINADPDQYTLYQMRATCNQERIFPENIPVNKYLGKEDLKLQSSQVYRKLRFFVGCCPHFFSCNKNVFLMNKNKIKRR